MDTYDQRRESRTPEAGSASDDPVRRYGSVRLPAVLAALPFCGGNRPCPKAEERRRTFLYASRFVPTASD